MIVNTPAAVAFLAARIREVMATKRYRRRPWSRKRIADDITTSEHIEGTLSDTTLGRFLDPGQPQQPSDATVTMVAEFLLHHRYMRREELDWIGQTASLGSGLSLIDFFSIPETGSHAKFLNDLGGHYVGVRVSEPFVLQTRLILHDITGQRLLAATEIMTLFRRPGIARALSQAQFSDIRPEIALRRIIETFDLRSEHEQTASGWLFASTDLMALFLKASDRGRSSIVSVDEVTGDDGEIVSLTGSRNDGWVFKDSEESEMSEPAAFQARPDRLMRRLAIDPQFSRVDSFEKIASTGERKLASNMRQRSFFDTAAERGDLVNTTARKLFNEAATADGKLEVALAWSELELFTSALERGADANITPNGSEEPLIFGLAKNGRLEWAKALLETGRCRMVKDRNGCFPSFHAAVLARSVAGVSGAEDLAARYGTLHDLLVAEEDRQNVFHQGSKPAGP